jgi:peptidoglycan hydrolase CwlO-like protein
VVGRRQEPTQEEFQNVEAKKKMDKEMKTMIRKITEIREKIKVLKKELAAVREENVELRKELAAGREEMRGREKNGRRRRQIG